LFREEATVLDAAGRTSGVDALPAENDSSTKVEPGIIDRRCR
jgi:hypothetical protein